MSGLDNIVKKIKSNSRDEIELIKKINNLDRDKHDGFISMDLKRLAFAHSELDVKGALEFFKVLNKELCS